MKNIYLIVVSFCSIGILLLPIVLNAQTGKKHSISGKISLLVGLETTTPNEVYVSIKSENKLCITDSLGQFEIKKLKPGTYKLAINGFGYQSFDTVITISKTISNLDFTINANCEVNKEIAIQDIKKNQPKLLLSGGIAPVYFLDQDKFEDKFQVKYYEYGCVSPAAECIEQYNTEIGKYLDNKFGKSWRLEVRQDVIGL